MSVATVGRPRKHVNENGEKVSLPAIVFRGTEEFMGWVDAFAKAEGLDRSKLLEKGLVELARMRRFPQTPPPRLG